MATLDKAIDSLEALGFEEEKIETSVYELGVLIPTSVSRDDLKTIQHHIKQWIFVIDRIEELVNGAVKTSIPVRSIASGSFDLFLSLDQNGAFTLLILAGGVYKIFQSVRDAARRREDLEAAHYPTEILKQLQDYEVSLIEKGKKEIIEKLMKHKSAKLPEMRENELAVGLKKAVDFVLRSMNEGVDVEISTPPDDETKEAAAEEVKQLEAKIDALRLEMTKISAALPDRSKPILSLPEAPNEGELEGR